MAQIADLDIRFPPANPFNDIGYSGGSPSTGAMLPEILDGESWWWIKSDNAADVREIIFFGRTKSGELAQEKIDLSGTTEVVMETKFSRLTWVKVNIVSVADTVSFGRVLRSGIKSKVMFTLDPNLSFVTIPFKDSKPDDVVEKSRYEKIHFKNNQAQDFTGMSVVVNDAGSIGGSIQIGTEAVVDSTTKVENRLQAPSGIVFADIGTPVSPQDIVTGESFPIWIRQTLPSKARIARVDAIAKLEVEGTEGTPPVDVFLDTFTDANGTKLWLHTCDTGGAWKNDVGGTWFEVQTNQAAHGAHVGIRECHTGAAAAKVPLAGYEFFCDVIRTTSNVISEHGFMFCMDDLTPFGFLFCFIEYNDANTVSFEVRRQDSGGQYDAAIVNASMPLTNGQAMRIGVTMVTGTSGIVWSEPAGGGARTIQLNPWILAVDYVIPTHDRMGLKIWNPSSSGRWDNLTMHDPGSSAPVSGDYEFLVEPAIDVYQEEAQLNA